MLAAAGLGRFMKFTFRTANASHPLGGCRMADTADLGVVDHRCEAFGYEGLFCMDSSAIPTSLGVNPSLTISAVCERAASELVDRAADLGLPASPQLTPSTPAEIVGDRVVAPDNDPQSASPAAVPAPSPAVGALPRRRRRRRKHRRRRKGAPR